MTRNTTALTQQPITKKTTPSRNEKEISNFCNLNDSDKYTVDGWSPNTFRDSIDRNSTMKSSDSEMKGIEVFWRVGSDKYTVSNALYGSNSEAQSSSTTFDSQNVPVRYACKDDDKYDFATRTKKEERDEFNTTSTHSPYLRAYSIISTDVSGNSSYSNSSGRTSPDRSGYSNTGAAGTYTSLLSSTDHNTSPSTTITTTTLNTNSNYSNGSSSFLSEGLSYMTTSREESSTITTNATNTTNEDDQETPKHSSMSYSSTSYSTNIDESDDLASLLFSDRIQSLFVETVDEDVDNFNEQDITSSVSDSSSELWNSEICVDAIVDLPWIFDDLNEDCYDECHKLNNEFASVKAVIMNTKSRKKTNVPVEPAIEVHSSSRVKKYLRHHTLVSQSNKSDKETISTSTKKKVAQEVGEEGHNKCWLVPLYSSNRETDQETAHHAKEANKNKVASRVAAGYSTGKRDGDKYDSVERMSSSQTDSYLQSSSEKRSNSGESNVSSKDNTPKMANTTNNLKSPKLNKKIKHKRSLDLSVKTKTQENRTGSELRSDDELSKVSIAERMSFSNEEKDTSEDLLGKLIRVRSTSPKATSTKIRSCVEEKKEKTLRSNSSELPCEYEDIVLGVKNMKGSEMEIVVENNAIELTMKEGRNLIETSNKDLNTSSAIECLKGSVLQISEENDVIELTMESGLNLIETSNVHSNNSAPETDLVVTVTDIKESSSNIISSVKSSQSIESLSEACSQSNEGKKDKADPMQSTDEAEAQEHLSQSQSHKEQIVNQSIITSIFNLIPSLCSPKERQCDKSLNEVTTTKITPLLDITTAMRFDGTEVSNTTFHSNTHLMTCICERAWEDSFAHLEASPLEARTWVAMKRQIGIYKSDEVDEFKIGDTHPSSHPLTLLPLHAACYFKAPLELIQNLLNIYPEAIHQKVVGNSKLPLHIACEAEVDAEIVTHLINAWPMSIYICDQDGNIPLTKTILSKPLTPRKREIMKVLLEQTKKVSKLQETSARSNNTV